VQLVLERPLTWAVPANASTESPRAVPSASPSMESRAEEQRLVTAARGGDERALATIYRRYRPRVFSVVARMIGGAEAEEVTQEVFLRAFRGLDGFRAEAQLSTWLYRIAVNASLSERARRSVERSRRAPESDAESLPAAETSEGDPALRARLEAALAALPPGYRAVLVLHDIEGLEHEEIGRVLDCRVGTSKSQLHKARAKMRDLLGATL
jgi:RNA polymerase sigma-70 factor (ECF subfamily)